RQCAGDIERHDHINLNPDQLGRKIGKPIQLSFRRAELKCNVLPLHIAQFTQSIPEFGLERLRVGEAYVQRTYSSHLGWLRTCRKRQRRRAAEQQADERAAPHSITSSAAACRESGTVRPSALAACRLMTSSNFVGCTTGRSLG